jgi:hypothetical protein
MKNLLLLVAAVVSALVVVVGCEKGGDDSNDSQAAANATTNPSDSVAQSSPRDDNSIVGTWDFTGVDITFEGGLPTYCPAQWPATLVINADGTYVATGDESQERGTWTYSNGNLSLSGSDSTCLSGNTIATSNRHNIDVHMNDGTIAHYYDATMYYRK